jgi:hypothetical protein
MKTTHETITSKHEVSISFFEFLSNLDITTLTDLGIKKVKKIRKSRDSKLQRMAAAFRTTLPDGTYKSWSINDLIDACSKQNEPLKEKVVKVYISVLRSNDGRFKMPIIKSKNGDLFTYTPIVSNIE